jgi:hypothetical protein
MLRCAILVGFVMNIATDARADQLIGLLTLPEVFGREPCDRFEPQEVTLYAGPITKERIGSIRVDKYWEFHAVGGCAGLEVRVHRTSGGVSNFPTLEYTYEAPAAIVLERRDRWFKVRLSDGVGWIHASERDEFHSLEALLRDGLTYLSAEFNGHLSRAPGTSTPAPGDRAVVYARLAEPPVRTIDFRRVNGQLWIDVEILSDSICTSSDPPTVTRRGWLPAHAANGQPTIWFYSRGC